MNENRIRKTILTKDKRPLRLMALSDGLFATVLTLLVLDLRIPEAINAAGVDMPTFVKWVGPHLFSYLLTFFLAGNYWLAHHRNFDHIIQYDRSFLGYNLLFLLFVGLFPFSTATLSLVTPSTSSYPSYWAIYAANNVCAGIMLSLTWLYAVSHGLVDPGVSRMERQHVTVRQITSTTVFLISVGAEYLYPQVFIGPWILLTLLPLQMLVDRIYAHTEPDRPQRQAAWLRILWQAGTTLLWLLIFGFAFWVMTR